MAAAPGLGAFFVLTLLLLPPPPLQAEEPAAEPADTPDAAQARARSVPAPVTDGGCPPGAAGHRRRFLAEGSPARGLPLPLRSPGIGTTAWQPPGFSRESLGFAAALLGHPVAAAPAAGEARSLLRKNQRAPEQPPGPGHAARGMYSTELGMP